MTVKLTIQNRQAQIEVIPSAAALIIKALNEPPRSIPKGQSRTSSFVPSPSYCRVVFDPFDLVFFRVWFESPLSLVPL